MAALKAALEKFRSQQQFSSSVLEQGRKDREEKLQKKATEARKPAKPRGRPKISTPSASQASDGPSVSAPSTHWKDLQPRRQLEPLGFRKKQVIDFLRASESPQTVRAILQGTGRDLDAEADLRSELAGQHNVSFDDSAHVYSYVSAVQVKDKAALLKYIRSASDPVAVGEVSDAYGAIKQDIEALKAEGLVYVLHSYDLGDDVIFPVDMRMAGMRPVQGELAELWRRDPLPEDDEDMAAELRKIGLKPAPRKAPRQRSQAQRKKKARKPSKLRHVTNVHLAHLGIFEGEAPTQID